MPSSTRLAAERIVASMRQKFGGPNTVVLVDQSEFGHLDLEAYARFEADMKARGFALMGDLEILEVSKSPTSIIARAMIRTMLSSDGRVIAEYYQLRPRIWRRFKLLLRGLLNLRLVDAPRIFARGMLVRHCVGFETEFKDGRQLITSNAQAAGMMSGPASIERHYSPYGTPTSTLIEYHLKRVKEVTDGDPEKVVQLRSLDDILNMQMRQQMMKVAHRKSIEWISHSEMQAMSGGNPEAGDAVFSEVRRLLTEEREQRGPSPPPSSGGVSYQRMKLSSLDEPQDHQLLQNVYEHLANLLGENGQRIESIAHLGDTPTPAKHMWYLWWCAAEVCGSGVSGWLVNHAPAAPAVIASHAALKAADAVEALELLEAGFAPARAWDAPFLHSSEVGWFDQFRGNPEWPSFDEIDSASYGAFAEPLSSKAAAYIRKHRAVL